MKPKQRRRRQGRHPLALTNRMSRIDMFVILTALLALLGAAEAEHKGEIRGKIIDVKTQKALGYANVVLVGTSQGAMSFESGEFHIPNVEPGKYPIKAMMMGYRTYLDTVEVFADSVSHIDFALETMIISETQVIQVLGSGASAARPQVPRGATSNSPQTEMPVDSAIDAIALTTGIVKTGDDLHARGGRSGEIQQQIDGVPVDDPLTPEDESKPDITTRHLRKKKSKPKPPPKPAPVTPVPGSESYAAIVENTFADPIDKPFSTFSVDVDAASYANTRRFVRGGRFPPRNAVRIEELINYFNYDYPNPSDSRPFSITTEVAECPWNKENKLVHVGLQGRRVPLDDLPESNLVFLIDVSGSMGSPDKLPLLQTAFQMLTQNLRDEDRVALVCYAGSAGLALDSTPGSEKETIMEAIARLRSGGSTAGGAGLKLAYKVAMENYIDGGNNRVILATDGDFNVGLSSDDAMVRLIEEKRESGVFLSVLGFGRGNLKDSKMEKIADHGNGNYHYIDSMLEARRVLVGQMAGTLWTIAKDVKIQIEFNPARVGSYRLIGYENRILNKEDFDNDKKDAGDIGAGHSVTALYEIVPADAEAISKHEEEFKYFSVQVAESALQTDELLTVRFRYKEPDADDSRLITQTVLDQEQPFVAATENFRFSAAVAEFGLLLRGSEYRAEASWEHAFWAAKEAQGDDPSGHRAEFVSLVAACREMADVQQE